MPVFFLKQVERLKSKKEGQKGSMAIEIVIGVFMLLIIISMLFDLILLGWRFYVIGQTSSFVTRTVALQGGVQHVAPEGFPGEDDQYLSVSELNKALSDSFSRAGVKDDEYKVLVNNYDITSGAETSEIDYRETIDVEVVVDYEWKLMSTFIPGLNIEHSVGSKRAALSEFKYRYDDWLGEE